MSEVEYMQLEDGWLVEECEIATLRCEVTDVLWRLEKHELEKLVKTVREIVNDAAL